MKTQEKEDREEKKHLARITFKIKYDNLKWIWKHTNGYHNKDPYNEIEEM